MNNNVPHLQCRNEPECPRADIHFELPDHLDRKQMQRTMRRKRKRMKTKGMPWRHQQQRWWMNEDLHRSNINNKQRHKSTRMNQYKAKIMREMARTTRLRRKRVHTTRNDSFQTHSTNNSSNQQHRSTRM